MITRWQLRLMVALVLVYSFAVAIAAVALGVRRHDRELAERVTVPASTSDVGTTTITAAELPTTAATSNGPPSSALPNEATGVPRSAVVHTEYGYTGTAPGAPIYVDAQAPPQRATNNVVVIAPYGGQQDYAIVEDQTRGAQRLVNDQTGAIPLTQTFVPSQTPQAAGLTGAGQTQSQALGELTPAQLAAQQRTQSQAQNPQGAPPTAPTQQTPTQPGTPPTVPTQQAPTQPGGTPPPQAQSPTQPGATSIPQQPSPTQPQPANPTQPQPGSPTQPQPGSPTQPQQGSPTLPAPGSPSQPVR